MFTFGKYNNVPKSIRHVIKDMDSNTSFAARGFMLSAIERTDKRLRGSQTARFSKDFKNGPASRTVLADKYMAEQEIFGDDDFWFVLTMVFFAFLEDGEISQEYLDYVSTVYALDGARGFERDYLKRSPEDALSEDYCEKDADDEPPEHKEPPEPPERIEINTEATRPRFWYAGSGYLGGVKKDS